MYSSKGWSPFQKKRDKCIKENWHENHVKQRSIILNKLNFLDLGKLYPRMQREFMDVISKPLMVSLKNSGKWGKKI